VSRGRTGGGFGGLRAAALIAVLAGAAVSVGFLLRATSRNPSSLLVVLLAAWVFCPFGAMLLANVAATRWSAAARATLRGVMLAVALGSVAVYVADALWPRASQPAFVFIVVPPASWLLGATVLAVAAIIVRRRSGRSGVL
jgi:hypothetical protein